MKRTATSANVAFATALLRDADAKAQSLPRNGPVVRGDQHIGRASDVG
jgi:hypothetical protein